MAERASKELGMIRKGLGEGGRVSGGEDMFETTENSL